MFMSILAIAAQAASPAGSINVSSMNGAALVRECQDSRALNLDACTGYIMGMADALQMERVTCRGNSAAGTLQTVEIVRRFVLEHPERWDQHGSEIVRAALLAAFPCQISN
jgi:hypothetical protein